ncbi:hypothetical protein SAMN02745227_00319 [Anaerobranca californiensis DSM 14826]|jgi:uncharacterized protein YaiI (UPF0178 family)|uniref:Uncharacterized protein n=1 Tax=Anaerobranca californiensis DSM 14826 TaxID=1120989 RepID=A0A1M6L073_9FIRM|nr:DUF188 domain-containing protein [Anaerobranca californiensis]SHJ64534.1 hypothetical protein SAMN02745227_00319 [Anaerobranca californiensis DSM 14826]
MRILIDGDGCPKVVKGCCREIAKKYKIPLIIYTTLAHYTDLTESQEDYVFLDCKDQSVDIKLVNDTKQGDIVITGDYGLASMVLARGGNPIGVRGEIFTHDNIDNFLLIRHQNAKLRQAKLLKGGPAKYSKEDIDKFTKNLLYLITNKKNNDEFSRKK